MIEDLQQLRSYAISFKTNPTTENDIRDNKMLSVLIINLTEKLLQELETKEGD